ncbi:hypothetical protein ES705_25116 [subsurface metagenome]
MEKQIVRRLQKSGNGMNVRVPPKVCEALQANKGDNLSFEFEPDSGVVKLSKVVKPNPGHDDVLDETHRISEFKSRADEPGKKEQSQQTETSEFEFCSSCGSENIEVNGNKFYCSDCDITYEVTPKGTKVVTTNPAKDIDIEHRVERLEQDVDEMLNNESGKNKKPGFLQSLFGGGENDNDGFIRVESDEDEDLVPVGADADEDEDEPRGFITW